MSGDWRQKPQYKTGLEQANAEAVAANAVGGVENLLRGTPLGSTQFDDADLNDMIDLVEHANPEHLELAGKALWDARDAISTAASDLHGNIRKVLAEWEGEGATQFQKWTKGLLDFAKDLETYAHGAGTEITTAASGLASVRKSMPPRDTRPADEQKRPWTLPKAKQVESNADYVLAKKVEKDRQDAINQMVRLGSFYSVAAGGLRTNPEPKAIEAIPDVGVPRPTIERDDWRNPYGSGASTPRETVREGVTGGHGTTTASHGTTTAPHGPATELHGTVTEPHRTTAGGVVPPLKEVHEPSGHPGHDVGTEINTVNTLPPPAHPTQPHPPAPTLPTAGGGGQTPPPPPGPMAPPIAPTAGRSPGYGPSTRLPLSTQGRTGPTGTGGGRTPQGPVGRATASGRVPQEPLGQAARATGRATPAGQAATRGVTQQPGRSPIGRGVTGGTPKVTNTPTGRTGTTGPVGATRSGVVGGKPVPGRTPGAASNPRVPRGMVVGSEESVSTTPPKGALGQRGVVGASTARTEPGAGQAALRSASSPDGVIGARRNNAGSTLKDSETSTGGSALGRGAVASRQSPNGEASGTSGSAEKEQHRPPQKQRRDVPQQATENERGRTQA
ncbi:WXG100 family type VII secretion target [Streptomyces sp. NK08204]|uniref:WXG100 family type VII secretion target n=1 Tax=Streptomyces sp. NK08204 TaxID=2873260 RepID=UPI001CED57C8|nr:WXG100 family type VII secretion target [Streptomyces sp. NK08204]